MELNGEVRLDGTVIGGFGDLGVMDIHLDAPEGLVQASIIRRQPFVDRTLAVAMMMWDLAELRNMGVEAAVRSQMLHNEVDRLARSLAV